MNKNNLIIALVIAALILWAYSARTSRRKVEPAQEAAPNVERLIGMAQVRSEAFSDTILIISKQDGMFLQILPHAGRQIIFLTHEDANTLSKHLPRR